MTQEGGVCPALASATRPDCARPLAGALTALAAVDATLYQARNTNWPPSPPPLPQKEIRQMERTSPARQGPHLVVVQRGGDVARRRVAAHPRRRALQQRRQARVPARQAVAHKAAARGAKGGGEAVGQQRHSLGPGGVGEWGRWGAQAGAIVGIGTRQGALARPPWSSWTVLGQAKGLAALQAWRWGVFWCARGAHQKRSRGRGSASPGATTSRKRVWVRGSRFLASTRCRCHTSIALQGEEEGAPQEAAAGGRCVCVWGGGGGGLLRASAQQLGTLRKGAVRAHDGGVKCAAHSSPPPV
jgi:hypothetical protein